MKYDKSSFLTLVGVFAAGLLVVSIAGCDGNSNNPTASPAAAVSSGHNSLLSAIAANIQSGESAYNPTITWGSDGFSVHEQWTDSNGAQRVIVAGITKYGSTADAAAEFKNLTITTGPDNKDENVVNDGHPTQYAQSEVAAALGHAPTINKDISWHYEGETQAQHEAIQYDNIIIFISQSLGITSGGPATPS